MLPFKILKYFFAFCLLQSIFVVFVFAQPDVSAGNYDEKRLRYSDYVKAQQELGKFVSKEEDVESEEKVPQPFAFPEYLHLYFAGTAGYDNNPELLTDKKSDGVFEEYLSASLDLPINLIPGFSRDTLEFTYQLDNINYLKRTQVNIFNQILSWEWKRPIRDSYEFSLEYQMEFYKFPDDSFRTFTENTVEFGFTWIHRYLEHGPRYTVTYRDYERQKARDTLYQETAKEREDWYHDIQYEIMVYVLDWLYVLHTENIAIQRSNDNFQHFNDYFSYRNATSITTSDWKRFRPVLNFGYESQNYRDRRIFDHPNQKEFDHYFYAGFSVFFKINRFSEIGFNYLYQRNSSNEPTEDYSASQVTWGVYLNF